MMGKFLVDVGVSVLVPFAVLNYLSGDDALGVNFSLVVAAAIPLAHGIYEYRRAGRINHVSLLGLIGVVLTPVIGLMRLDNTWLAVKETAIPLAIGVLLMFLKGSKYDFVGKIIDRAHDKSSVDLHDAVVSERYHAMYDRAFYTICGAFFLSAMLNFVFVKLMVTSAPGTLEYNQELGRMTLVSFIVIGFCSCGMIIYSIFRFVHQLAGLETLAEAPVGATGPG